MYSKSISRKGTENKSIMQAINKKNGEKYVFEYILPHFLADKELSSKQSDKGTSLDGKSKSLSSRETSIPRIDMGHFAETFGNATEVAANIAGTTADIGLGMLESTLDTPAPTTLIGGGGPPKSLEDKKKKKGRGR